MIIWNAFVLDNVDPGQFAWASLRRFHNVDYVEGLLCRLHGLPRDQRQNARKQASQIRYCLTQAKEYYDAAERVSLATQPTLLYYCIMSLALAEILFKQSGESSLDRAREQHRHHGLTLKVTKLPKHTMAFEEATAYLAAVPLAKSGARFGTFELWHRSARGLPITAETIKFQTTVNSTTSYESAMGGSDSQYDPIPESGITLLDCLNRLPSMVNHFYINGLHPNILRGRMRVTHRDGKTTYQVVIHPAAQSLFDEFLDNVSFHPSDSNAVRCTIAGTGAQIDWSHPEEEPVLCRFPSGTMLHRDEVHFWPKSPSLNEFGLFYVALYILGNYARYYPDRWMVDVDAASPLALAAEQLLKSFTTRVPMLTLSELTRTYFVSAS